MNKKLISLAVAAAITAPAAALADATLYGKLHVSIDYFDVDGGGYKGWTLNKGQVGEGAGRANRVGVKGSEDLGGGLKAIYQVEFGVPLANESDYDINNGDKGNISMRNSFVGMAGSFGTFLVGRHDTPLKISTGKLDMFSDTMADYNGTVGFLDVRADNAIAYISPSFSGFQLAGAIVPGAASTIGGDANIDSDSIAEGWSLAGIYKNGPFYGSLAYERLGQEMNAGILPDPDDPATPDTVTVTGIGTFDVMPGSEGGTILVVPDEDWNRWRVGLGILDWNGFSLTGIYEDHSNVGGVDGLDQSLWQVQAGYSFGNNTIKGMYGSADRDGDTFSSDDGTISIDLNGDKNTWAVAFDHNFSKRTRAYILYTDVDDDENVFGDSWSGFSLGMIHKF